MPAYTWTTAETITAAKLNTLETEAWKYLNILAVASTTSEQSTTSNTYDNVSPSVSFTPQTTSVLVAVFAGGAYMGSSTARATLGVNVNSVDYDISHWVAGNDGTTAQATAAGAVLVTGLTAGNTYTAQTRLKNNGSSNSCAINRDGGSRATIIVLGIGK